MRFMGRGEVRKQVEYPAKDMERCFLNFDDMRAADCRKLAEKPEGVFRQAQNSLYCGTGSFFDELELCRSLCSNAIQNDFILVLPNY